MFIKTGMYVSLSELPSESAAFVLCYVPEFLKGCSWQKRNQMKVTKKNQQKKPALSDNRNKLETNKTCQLSWNL